MRRFWLLALSCLSLLGLVACGVKRESSGQGDKTPPAAGSMGKMTDGMGSMKQ